MPLATDLTARLAQLSRQELFSDPQTLTQAFLDAAVVCGFECIVIDLGPAAVSAALRREGPEPDETLGVVREAAGRLRMILGERIAIVLVLPGPRTMASHLGLQARPEELEGLGERILAVFQSLHPQLLDAVAVSEAEPLDGREAALADALSPVWNTARYYSMPSLLLAARAGRAAASVGAAAVAVWAGASPEELAAAGPARVGVPVQPGAHALPPLPAGGFYITRGEIPAQTEVEAVRDLVRRASG